MTKRITVLLFILLSIFSSGKTISAATVVENKVSIDARLKSALEYCRKNKMNTSYCILVDMDIHSGKNRLLVYNFKAQKVVIKSLCAHGSGGGSTALTPVYSNKPGSNCTALGKYKLGKRAYSNWGINVHYKMHGLEKTNDNAFKRIIVLHSYDPVPKFETYPLPVFGVSSGCPVVSNEAMRKIDQLIKSGQKNMLLWIYDNA